MLCILIIAYCPRPQQRAFLFGRVFLLLDSLEVPLYAHYLCLVGLLASASFCLYLSATAIKVPLRPLISSRPIFLSREEITTSPNYLLLKPCSQERHSSAVKPMAQYRCYAFIPQPSNRWRTLLVLCGIFESSYSVSNLFSITDLNTIFFQQYHYHYHLFRHVNPATFEMELGSSPPTDARALR